jgi:hypothetical protein
MYQLSLQISFVIARQGLAVSGYITGHLANLRAVNGAAVYRPSSPTIPVANSFQLGATSGGGELRYPLQVHCSYIIGYVPI